MTNLTLRRAPWRAPFAPLFARDRDLFGNDVRKMFDTMLEPRFGVEPVGMMPAVELAETNDDYTCTIELPGMKQKDISVMFENDTLTIKGEKREETEKKEGKRLHVWERTYGAFERAFTFPGKVDVEKIAAAFADGVLTVTLPKTAEAKPNGKMIKIAEK
jgi:HSP20 family protein